MPVATTSCVYDNFDNRVEASKTTFKLFIRKDTQQLLVGLFIYIRHTEGAVCSFVKYKYCKL